MQVVSLSSGSHGNATLIQSADGALLVDAGLPLKTLLARCAVVGTTAPQLRGVVLTHEHGDHTTSIATLTRKLQIPLYTMPATRAAIAATHVTSFIPLQYGVPVDDTLFTIHVCPVSHDAVAPIAVCVDDGVHRVAVATDLGEWDDTLVHFMQAADLVIIEANHDRERLRLSRYDAQLKLRIASKTGHLDNMQAGAFLAELARDGKQRDAWLAHLSKEANSAELATRTVRNVLAMHQRVNAYRSIQAMPAHTHLVWGPAHQGKQQRLWHDD